MRKDYDMAQYSMRLAAVAGCAFLLLLSSAGYGQLVGRPDRGYKAGNSYSISDIESVNLTGGNVAMSIPLASLPAGRGASSGYSVSLTYDSKLWNTQQEWNSDATDEFGARADYTRNLLELSAEGGWRVDTSYQLNIIDRDESGRRELCTLGNTDYNKNSYRWRVEMQTPGGGAISFRPVGYDDYFKDGFFEVNTNGYVYEERYAVNFEGRPACQYSPYQSTTAGMTYYSTDGSGIRLFIPYGAGGSGNWKMYFPDGRLVENAPPDDTTVSQRIADRNGNWINIKGAGMGSLIEDQLGRTISFGREPNGDTKVFQSGVGGGQLETTIKWKEYWVFRNYRATDVSTTLNIPVAKTRADTIESFLAVDQIILPAQAGSLVYDFAYLADTAAPDPGSTDYTGGWGELASVTMPSGAKADYSYDLPANEVVLTTAMDIIRNTIKRKDLTYDETYDGQTAQKTDTWLYSIAGGGGTVTAPDGGVTGLGGYYKSPSLQGNAPSDWNAGLVYRSTNPDGSTVEKLWEQNGSAAVAAGQPMNPYVKTEFANIPDAFGQPALTAIKDYIYDRNMNVLEVREYDWVSYASAHPSGVVAVIPGGAVLKRKTLNE